MEKLKPKVILIPAIALFVICLVVTLLLAVTNMFTKDKIAEQSLIKEEQARTAVLSQAESFTPAELKSGSEAVTYYIGSDKSGKTVGYVFSTEAKGYGGNISVMTGVGIDGKISGVKILSHGETPGLGAKTANDSFLSQFNEKNADSELSVIKSGTPRDTQIEAVTGATISSTAVTDSVNKALDMYSKIGGSK